MNQLTKIVKRLESDKNYSLNLKIIYFFFISSSIYLAFSLSPFPEFDELAYIKHVEEIANSNNFWYLGDRNRMPLFNYMLFTFYNFQLLDLPLYRIYQLTNIFFTTVFSLIYFKKLKTYFNSNIIFCSCIVFILFIPILAFIHDVVVEPIFYLSFGLLFLSFLDLNNDLSYKNSIKFAIICAVVYLLKATGLFLFLLSIIYLILIKVAEKSFKIQILSKICVSICIFFVIISPYIYENYTKFNGHLFYNVNSTFYVWYDTYEQVESGTKLYGDRVGWPDMPESEIPSLEKYIKTHSLTEILSRFLKGFKSIFYYYFSPFEFTGAITVSFTLLLLQIIKNLSAKSIFKYSKDLKIWISYLIYLSGFVLTSTAWYMLTNSVQRFSMLLAIPTYSILFVFIDKFFVVNSDSSKVKNFFFIVASFFVSQSFIIFNYIL